MFNIEEPHNPVEKKEPIINSPESIETVKEKLMDFVSRYKVESIDSFDEYLGYSEGIRNIIEKIGSEDFYKIFEDRTTVSLVHAFVFLSEFGEIFGVKKN